MVPWEVYSLPQELKCNKNSTKQTCFLKHNCFIKNKTHKIKEIQKRNKPNKIDHERFKETELPSENRI